MCVWKSRCDLVSPPQQGFITPPPEKKIHPSPAVRARQVLLFTEGDYVMCHEQETLKFTNLFSLHNAQGIKLPPTTQYQSIHNSQQTQFMTYN